MTKSKILRLVALPVVVATAAIAFAAPASAAPGGGVAGKAAPDAGPGLQVVSWDGYGMVATAAPSTLTKAAWNDKYGPAKTIQPFSGTLTSSGYASGPAGSQSFYTYGTSHWSSSCGVFSCTTGFSQNSSTSEWLGSSPFNANEINASMKWWISGVLVSVSLPPGVGFSAAGSAVIWQPGSVSNTWLASLSYQSSVDISAQIISSNDFTDQADIRLGSSWYHVQGN